MNKKPFILGIESSCDETAASIISENNQGYPIILSNIISSQVDIHKKFGGVVPELAARSHIDKIDWIVQKAIDDAIGEAFDKTAKLLGIDFPGGPQIEILAKKGDPNKYILPKPIFNKGGCNLSFAGLKTAILRITKNIKTDQEKFDLAASFQKTVIEILYKKTRIAFKAFEKQVNSKEKKFVVAGGVAANKEIRKMLFKLCEEENYKPIFPPTELCGDNAAMIAMVGLEKFKLNQFNNLDHPAKPRWPLDENAAFLKGAGVKF